MTGLRSSRTLAEADQTVSMCISDRLLARRMNRSTVRKALVAVAFLVAFSER